MIWINYNTLSTDNNQIKGYKPKNVDQDGYVSTIADQNKADWYDNLSTISSFVAAEQAAKSALAYTKKFVPKIKPTSTVPTEAEAAGEDAAADAGEVAADTGEEIAIAGEEAAGAAAAPETFGLSELLAAGAVGLTMLFHHLSTKHQQQATNGQNYNNALYQQKVEKYDRDQASDSLVGESGAANMYGSVGTSLKYHNDSEPKQPPE